MTFKQLNLDVENELNHVTEILEVALQQWFCHNEPFEVIFSFLKKHDVLKCLEIGKSRKFVLRDERGRKGGH